MDDPTKIADSGRSALEPSHLAAALDIMDQMVMVLVEANLGPSDRRKSKGVIREAVALRRSIMASTR